MSKFATCKCIGPVSVLCVVILAGCEPSATQRSSSEKPKTKIAVADMTNEQFVFEVRRLADKNDYKQAIEMLSERIKAHPDDESLKRTMLATKIQYAESIARIGDLPTAATIMEEIGQLGRELFTAEAEGADRVDYIASLLCEARARAYASDVEGCVDSIRAAIELGYGNLEVLKQDPFFGKLRSSDQYAQMIGTMLKANAAKDILEYQPVEFDFTLPDLNGNNVALSDSHGKIRIIDVWGTWCLPCLSELPSFIRLQKNYADDVVVIGLTVERTETETEARQQIQTVVDQAGINYTCVLGTDNTTRTVPGFKAFPTTLFIDRTGKVRLRLDGTQSYDKMQSVVEYLIAEQQ
ncbi:MAG: TlpA family protein disulfide reductase [Planctomycetales bacterium]|nr:TlpA family protein disulfide reductase [Planctomycetales bacterium]